MLDFSFKLQEVKQNLSGGKRRPLVDLGMGKVEEFFVLATSKSISRGGGLVTFLSVYICTATRTSSTSICFFRAWFEKILALSEKKIFYELGSTSFEEAS